ncbi:MAG TPA: GAF domain-containing protein [Microthrixaceae bacterium]|nr:GAF domain-containing protein [Microthrixaceae bacterium]
MAVQRSGTRGGLSVAVERLSEHAEKWGTGRLLDEGLDLVRDSTWADVSALYAVEEPAACLVARRPGWGVPFPAHADAVPGDWFPWGLAPVHARRFVLVEDASTLPCAPPPAPTLGELGFRSCLHLPILERSRLVGALHLYWVEPRLAWDDDHGRLLRTLGRYLLSAATR